MRARDGATLWPALVGGAIGAAAGWAYLSASIGRPADPRFGVALGILAVLAPVVAAALPAVHAATRDPLRALRVP